MSKVLARFAVAIFACLFTVIFASAQGDINCHLSEILTSQKKCWRKLAKTSRLEYVTLINLAPLLRPKLLEQIKRLDPNSPICASSHYSIFEGYDLAGSVISGVIWVDSVYFSYINQPSSDIGSKLVVKKVDYAELSEVKKAIVSNFNDWGNPIFTNPAKSIRYVNPPLYYLATRASFVDKPKIESIAFCY